MGECSVACSTVERSGAHNTVECSVARSMEECSVAHSSVECGETHSTVECGEAHNGVLSSVTLHISQGTSRVQGLPVANTGENIPAFFHYLHWL